MKFQFVFLGTGTSQGVPVIGCECQICQSGNDKDNRLRSSLLVKTEFGNILIDIGPDFRQQMLNAKTTNLNSVLITHQHRDHTAGLDDLRPIYYFNKQPIEIYGEQLVVESLKNENEINIVEDQWNNPTWTSSLAVVIEKAIDKGLSGLFHWGDRDWINRYEFAIKIASAFGLKTSLIKPILTKDLKQSASRPLKSGLKTDFAQKLLNLEPPSIEECLDSIKKQI